MTETANPLCAVSDLVLHGLVYNDSFYTAAIPHLQKEYWESDGDKVLFQEILDYHTKYSGRPSPSALFVGLQQRSGISEQAFEESANKLDALIAHESTGTPVEPRWLTDSAEKWCQDRALYIAVTHAAEVLQGDTSEADKKGKVKRGQLPEMIQAALSISFQTSIGHDYWASAETQFDFYHDETNRIPFKIDMFNRITKGGVFTKTLNVYMSNQTGGFKSGTMCDHAAFLQQMGYDVLYITLEMSEEKIRHRLDANLMDLELDVVETLGREDYMARIAKLKEKAGPGRVIIKEYPTGSAHAGHFRFLLKELKAKHNFNPRVVFVDYLNLCASARSIGRQDNSYTYVKNIAEELRSLAQELDIAIFSATQGNRDGLDSSDVSLSNTSESIGLPATCDLFIAIITSEDLDGRRQLLFKQLKNRYGPLDFYRRFYVGVNKAKMMLFDCSQDEDAGVTTVKDATKAKPQPTNGPPGSSEAVFSEMEGRGSKGERFGSFQF